MIKVDEDNLIHDLLLTSLSFDTASREFVKKEYNNFGILNKSLGSNYGKVVKTNDGLNKNQNTIAYKKYKDDAYWSFVEKAVVNQDILKEIALHMTRFKKKIKFKKFKYFDVARNYSEKDYIDLILSFFSTFGNKQYEIAKKYFDEKRINIGSEHPYKDKNTAGYFAHFNYLESGYIFVPYNEMNSMSASSIVHELGHAIDAETFIFPQKKKLAVFDDLLLEVPSTTYETEFYNYLINQKIDEYCGMILKNDKVSLLLDSMKFLREAIVSDHLYITKDGYAINEEGYKYQFRKYILYGLGYYFALHLNEIRKNSNEEFLKVLNNLSTTRKESSLKDSIDILGFNYNDFLTGKNIKEDIKETNQRLIKRYK